MSTLTALPHLPPAPLAKASDTRPPAASKRPSVRPLTDEEVEQRVERARIRTGLTIAAGVMTVCFVLAVVLYGWKLAALCTIGLTMYALLFGGPFWLAAIDSEAEKERARHRAGTPH